MLIHPPLLATAVLATSLGVAGVGAPASATTCAQPGPYQLPQGSDQVHLDPAAFSTDITNPYWPMVPGTVWHYVEKSDGETAEVTTTVTSRTITLGGVRARVVHDVARVKGEVTEATDDWYAQDAGGSIWYLGEKTATYRHGKVVSRKGSWSYGTDGAQAGVIVPAAPAVGCAYREEYHQPDAQDQALVLSLTENITGRTGRHTGLLHTANTSPLEPTALENKYYARGIGPILELDLSPSLGTAELVSVTHSK